MTRVKHQKVSHSSSMTARMGAKRSLMPCTYPARSPCQPYKQKKRRGTDRGRGVGRRTRAKLPSSLRYSGCRCRQKRAYQSRSAQRPCLRAHVSIEKENETMKRTDALLAANEDGRQVRVVDGRLARARLQATAPLAPQPRVRRTAFDQKQPKNKVKQQTHARSSAFSARWAALMSNPSRPSRQFHSFGRTSCDAP